MNYTAAIASALQEIRDAALEAQTSPSIDGETLAERYDMLFMGERFNVISGVELCHALNVKFGVPIALDAFLLDIPRVCADLGIDIQPLVQLEDIGKRNPQIADYSIILF